MIEKRDIATNLILTIITCGIYGLFWLVTITDDTARINREQTTSGGVALILSLITCGIYGIYWNYRMAQCIYLAEKEKGIPASDNSLICLLLSVFRLDLVSYCIMQSELNRLATARNEE